MKLINALGYAGLLPFVLLPLAYHLQWQLNLPQLLQLYMLYSALILGFMAGVLWPVLHQRADYRQFPTDNSKLALVAVSFPVVSIVGLMLMPDYFLLLQALLFALLRITEYLTAINKQYPISYQHLRHALTLVVCSSHLLMQGLMK